MIGEKGRIILGKTLAPKRNFHQFPIRINGKKGPKGKTIATVKVQVNPTLKRRPSGCGWECGWKGGGVCSSRIKRNLRPERRFYEDTYSVSHKTMKQQHAFDKHE